MIATSLPASLGNLAFLMPRSRFALRLVPFIGLMLSLGIARAEPAPPAAQGVGLAIADFAYVDTSGEPADQAAAHQQRLQALMSALRQDFTADTQFHLVPVSCAAASCTVAGPTPPDLLRAAADAGAKILVVGGIHKESTLVQWAKVQAIDVDANRVIFDKLFTFRGDSDEAWQRAEVFISRELRVALSAH